MPRSTIVPVTHLVADAARDQRFAVRLQQRVVDDPRQPERVDDRLLIESPFVGRQHERAPAARTERAAEKPFDDAALPGRLARRERIACVEMRVAEDQVAVAVVLLPSGLGEDLDAAAPGPRVFRRIRILVDLDLLHGGRADV
jgi:hypothetical protein